MIHKIFLTFGFFAAVPAQAQTAPPLAVYKSGADLMAIIKSKIPATPDQADAPVSNESAYRINVVRRGIPGVAMAHATGPAKGTEVHYIIDGAATVITGGPAKKSSVSSDYAFLAFRSVACAASSLSIQPYAGPASK